MVDFLNPIVYNFSIVFINSKMATNYVICSASDVIPVSQRGGSTGLKYPWLDTNIPVGKGFFIERSLEDYEKDKGRPSIPTTTLAKYGIKYRTYKAKRGLTYGYMCERVK
jgi:hypothetical protein